MAYIREQSERERDVVVYAVRTLTAKFGARFTEPWKKLMKAQDIRFDVEKYPMKSNSDPNDFFVKTLIQRLEREFTLEPLNHIDVEKPPAIVINR